MSGSPTWWDFLTACPITWSKLFSIIWCSIKAAAVGERVEQAESAWDKHSWLPSFVRRCNGWGWGWWTSMEFGLYLMTMTLTISWRALLPAESPSLLRRWFTLPCAIFWSGGSYSCNILTRWWGDNSQCWWPDHSLQHLMMYLRKGLGQWTMANVKTSSKSLCCANCLWVVATHCSKYSNLSTKFCFAKWHTVEKPQADIDQHLPQKFVAILEEKINDRGFENLEKSHLCNCSSFMPLTSPASLLIMSSGILRSTLREEFSKAL